MAKKKETVFTLINGELVETSDKNIATPDLISQSQQNEPLDRTRITPETKKALGILLEKIPEIRPVIEILIGKTATEKLK